MSEQEKRLVFEIKCCSPVDAAFLQLPRRFSLHCCFCTDCSNAKLLPMWYFIVWWSIIFCRSALYFACFRCFLFKNPLYFLKNRAVFRILFLPECSVFDTFLLLFVQKSAVFSKKSGCFRDEAFVLCVKGFFCRFYFAFCQTKKKNLGCVTLRAAVNVALIFGKLEHCAASLVAVN